ncbi:aminotransferase-like domain-containing protein [Amycolatopsis pigmentata]|uniref:PLP-dependent aminotransferase family protein n=1 Tax=Amycolatopsis pigmentata TaxID=450801 RepID=A0ABW5FST6_9PSEU
MSEHTGRVLRFSRGIPPIEAIPGDRLAEQVRAVLDEFGPTMFQYPPIGSYLGDPALREQLAKAHNADPDHIVVTTGSLQALDLLATRLLTGDSPLVYVEGPTYDRAARIFERHGARVSSIPVESDGMDIGRLRDRLRDEVPDVLYTIPDFQNPSGVTLSGEKRRELVELAEVYGFTVLEDIPYRRIRFHGTPPPGLGEIAGSARVITIGSLSKVLSPGLRVGYAVSDGDTARTLATLSEGVYLSPVPLCQAVAARCLRLGIVDENVARIVDLLRPRHDAAEAAVRAMIGDAMLAVPGGGYYIGVRLSVDEDEQSFIDRASREGLALIPGSAFYPRAERRPPGELFLRLPFQSLTPDEFEAGVGRLSTVISARTRLEGVNR